jgi:hypothetical protein
LFQKIISEIYPIFKTKVLMGIVLLLKTIMNIKPLKTVLSKESNLKSMRYNKNVRLNTIFLSHKLIIKNIDYNLRLLKILKLSLYNAIY